MLTFVFLEYILYKMLLVNTGCYNTYYSVKFLILLLHYMTITPETNSPLYSVISRRRKQSCHQ